VVPPHVCAALQPHAGAQPLLLPVAAPPLRRAGVILLRLSVAPLLLPRGVLLRHESAPLLPQVSVALPQLAGALLLLPHAAVSVLLQSDAVLQPDVVPTSSVAWLCHLFLERSPES